MTMDDLQQRLIDVIVNIASDEHHIVQFSLNRNPLRKISGSDPIPDFAGIKGTECYAYEDAGMATGLFLSAESLRCLRTGSKEALANARHAFEGVSFIYELGKERQEGFFPKPYGGRFSTSMSRDQYLLVMDGLCNFLPLASPEEKAKIRRMLEKMASYWRDIHYSPGYFTLKPSSQLHDHIGGIFMAIASMPCVIEECPECLCELNRLADEEKLTEGICDTLREQYRRGFLQDNGQYFRNIENSVSLKAVALNRLRQVAPERLQTWRQAAENIARDELFATLNKTDRLDFFFMKYERERDCLTNVPPQVMPELTNPLKLPQLTWGGRRRFPGSIQDALAAVFISSITGNAAYAAQAREILEGFSLDKFASMTVDSPEDVPPGREFECNLLRVTYMSCWLYACEAGRLFAFWK